MTATTLTADVDETVPPPSSNLAILAWSTKVVCHRELLRLSHDRVRLASMLAQPLLFLFVMGAGLSNVTGGASGVDYRTFLYPGVIAQSVLFSAMFSAMSIVWDREMGFLREMLVAPVPRTAILTGKALGGSIVATGQGIVILVLAGLADVPYDPLMLVSIVVQVFLLAFAISAFGLVVAARVHQMQTIMGVMSMLVMPLFFLSGALYPLANLPDWLQVLARFNPLTYAITAMRHTVFDELDLSATTRDALDPGLTWFGWQVPTVVAVAMVGILGMALLRIAIAEFRKE